MFNDLHYLMHLAMEEAAKAAAEGEIPIGAVLTDPAGKIVAKAHNRPISFKDPTAHAEILAITAAANTIEDWRLTDCTLYVTKEPCAMCAGAIINSRIKSVIFGCYDSERGYCGSIADLCGDPRLKNDINVRGGINEERCLGLIQDFFKTKRKS